MLINAPTDNVIGSTLIEKSKTEYNENYIQYPLDVRINIPSDIYMNEQMLTFWNDVSIYLPYKATISKALITPEIHALSGLKLLQSKDSKFDFSTIVVLDFKSSPTSNTSQDFFSSSNATTESQAKTRTLTRTNPELNGKFDKYFLFQFDYSKLQKELSKYSITWSLPNSDNYQKGLQLDIDLSKCTQNKTEVLNMVKWIATNNPYLNISTQKITGTTLNVIFKSNNEYKFEYEYGLLNIGPQNNTTDCFGSDVTSKIYKILKDNGYGDLDETISHKYLTGLPLEARKKGTALSKALKDIMIEVLGGSNGLISVMQASTNEYLMGIINGLLAANKVLYVELDKLSNGNVSEQALKAFESGANKSVISPTVKTVISGGLDINKSVGKGLLSKQDASTINANIEAISADLALSRVNQAKS